MSRLPKVLLNGHVVFLSFSVEEGFPFPPNDLMNTILESALARAQHLYPVKVSHHLFETTHAHMILVVENPNHIKHFVRAVKTESAHAVNRLLGRKKRTIWCEGYDSPTVLTVEDMIEKIAYIYTNPSKDGLEDSIERFPGLSSWKAFLRGERIRTCPRIRRNEYAPLKSTRLTIEESKELAKNYRDSSKSSHDFHLDFDLWMSAFDIHDPEEKQRINQRIVERVKELEGEYRKERKEKGLRVKGAKNLMLTPLDTPYVPKRTGRKMWCICRDIELRKAFISAVKALVQKGKEVYERWHAGDFSVPYPLGLFPPSMPKLGEHIGALA
ncbi:MAG: transposase [Bdellovibrionales bacterium]|nr:transposase [Bdellovibrionales bacterium]